MSWALTGEFAALDRDALTRDQLRLLRRLEVTNMVLLSRGLPYAERKQRLAEAAGTPRVEALPCH